MSTAVEQVDYCYDPAAYHCHERLAHHEAGHAIASIWLGFGCETIVIFSHDRGILGRTYFGNVGSSFELAVMLVAGPVAEARFCRENGQAFVLKRRGSDCAKINQIAKALGIKPPTFRELVWQRAQKIVEHPVAWAAITVLAHELVERFWANDLSATMTGDEAQAIVRTIGTTVADARRGHAALATGP
jgi:hypothetical protein